ncbi:MAG: ArsR family transcriptional regulator [Bacteroidota bacterium]
MLDSLITSKTRIKLLTRLFLNSNSFGHLRGLQAEFHESSNAIRIELNRFEKAGLLTSHTEANRKVYAANTSHPLFPEINSLLRKNLGLDQLVERVIEKIGMVEMVYLTGDFACGKESPLIEMLIIGEKVNTVYLDELIAKSQEVIKRTIKYTLLNTEGFLELSAGLKKEKLLLLWERNK